MSTITIQSRGVSDDLCRRFAIMASEYLEAPERAKNAAAQVPLENLFRVLQMYKYDAFADEQRSGILAKHSDSELDAMRLDDEEWHFKIEAAMTRALDESFRGFTKDDAIAELQATLRWLASAGVAPNDEVRGRSRAFFNRLGTALG